MAKKEQKREGFFTAKDKEHGLFGNSKATHKDVIGKLEMGKLMTDDDKNGLYTKKDKDRGLM